MGIDKDIDKLRGLKGKSLNKLRPIAKEFGVWEEGDRAADLIRKLAGVRDQTRIKRTETGWSVSETIAEGVPQPGETGRSKATQTTDFETHPEAVLLPREAVLRELQKAHVFVAEDDVAEKRSVTLGLEEGDLIEVISGVEAGDQVIVTGQGGLKDGSAVKILIADANAG